LPRLELASETAQQFAFEGVEHWLLRLNLRWRTWVRHREDEITTPFSFFEFRLSLRSL
jgi:hypothetical protein